MTSKILLYDALDQSGNSELWQTNGTQSGTVEVTPGLESSQVGINPRWMVAFNGKVLFNGVDASGDYQLWVTNGTLAGTQELTGIVNANPNGLYPEDMTVYNGEVLFQGQAGLAGGDVTGLWETNGTAAGTTEIGGNLNGGVSNAYTGGLLAVGNPDFTPFGGVVLFRGRDSANNVGLWETNGTASGTFELAPISGAFAVGSPGSDVQPAHMTVLGNEVLFDGADQQDTPGSLWETNGTAAGTFEIGGQGNALISGSPNGNAVDLPIGIAPTDLVTFNGKVLFSGTDSTTLSNGGYAHTEGLWITDGTAGGTMEIGGLGNAGIANINSPTNGGIFWAGSIAYPDLTAYKNIVLFEGYDSSNHAGLWETNGTPGGTFEIGGLGNAGIAGGLSLNNSSSPNFTVYDGEVFFYGIDGTNHSGLWETNGTAAGTIELTTPSFGSPFAPLGPDFTPYGASVANSYTGLPTSDILLQNSAGTIVDWIVNNGAITAGNNLGTNSGWNPVATGDFTGDGTSDILLTNSAGTVVDWAMGGGTVNYASTLGSTAGFNIVGTGDFNGDGVSDILLENSAGTVVDWMVSNGAITAGNNLGTNAGWNVVGTGDFNGDGTSDVLLENSSGTLVDWTMRDGTVSSAAVIGNAGTYTVVGVGDFTGNGTADILLRNSAGDVVDWIMANGAVTGSHDLGVNAAWNVAAIGEYNGNAVSDILLTNNAGAVVDWTMTNGVVSHGALIGNTVGFTIKH